MPLRKSQTRSETAHRCNLVNGKRVVTFFASDGNQRLSHLLGHASALLGVHHVGNHCSCVVSEPCFRRNATHRPSRAASERRPPRARRR